MADYILIGGHGKVALRTAPLLVEAGHTVTSIIRNPDQADAIRDLGATPLVLDVQSATTDDFAAAFAGKDAVIWSAGAGGGNPERTYAVDRDAAQRTIGAAAQAGVNRYAMVSYAGAGPDHGVPESSDFYPYAQAKTEADAYLRASGLDYTILGPGKLTLDEPSGRIQVTDSAAKDRSDDARRDTSRGNVAQTIVATLAEPATIGKTINYYDGDTEITAALASL